MAEFGTYIEIDPYEYIDNCSRYEIEELIEHLIDLGHISGTSKTNPEDKNLLDLEWDEKIEKLSRNRIRLSKENEEIITQITNSL